MKKIFLLPMILLSFGMLPASAQTTTTTTKTGASQPKKDAIIGGVAGATTGLIVGHKKR